MSFMDRMRSNILESDGNVSVTENGAVGYRTTGKELLDLNFAVASLRRVSEADIANRFTVAYQENPLLALKWLFFARDVRGGLGERRLFRSAMKSVAEYHPDIFRALIPLFAEYGRYDDLWPFLDVEAVRQDIIKYVDAVFKQDIYNAKNGKPATLLAKWMPSSHTDNPEGRRWFRILRAGLGLTSRQYRLSVSELRRYLEVVEVKMSSGDWAGIEYAHVPSRANLFYNNAFLRHDEARRREFLASVKKGEAKINAGTLFPHDIVHKYSGYGWGHSYQQSIDETVEALWNALPDMVAGCGNTMVVADGSGSMSVGVDRSSSVTALDVANALAIYFSEHATGDYKDKYITFSEHPQFVDFSNADTLLEKLHIADSHNEVANTNIEAVFDLILNTAVADGMEQKDMPQNILIISDMEFDSCACSNSTADGSGYWSWRAPKLSDSLFKNIGKRYAARGYKMPRLIFWNVNSRTSTIPVRKNELGVALVSGFSVNVCKMVLSGKLDPFECLLETINDERYKPVQDAVESLLS